MSDQERQHYARLARQVAQYAHVGTMFPVAIGIGFLGGLWLDGQFGTRPWLALLGFVLGIAAALRNLLRAVRHMNADTGASDSDAGGGEPGSER